ncbi:MAG: PQQ-like beta-propeller repeat protein [Planctomycetes bacterium]|nr:PQQ-like beta-propeller repeat protein [Planctomycetota bacterium]
MQAVGSRGITAGAFGLLAVVSADVALADWANFRGPRHDGISDEKGIKTAWTEPIPLLWDRTIGSGFSSFACVGDRIYTAGTQDKQQVLFCLNADSGAVVWQKALEPEYPERMGGDGPRATPTVDEGRVYMLGARGKLVCLAADTGEEIWSTTFNQMPQWGYSGSVLIEDDLAVSSGGGDDGALVAFDKKSGKVVWKTGDDPAGYSTPYPFAFEGTRYLVGFTGNSAIIVEAKTGRLALRIPWKTDWDVNAAAPIFHDGHLLLTSGYTTGAGLFKLRRDGDNLAAEPVWESKVLMNKFQSCILHQGKLYASDQKALVCADFLTGKEAWRKPRITNGTLVLVGEHLILLTENGQLQIAKADPGGFEPVTTAEVLSGRCWTVPVLHRGRLYARNMDRVVCFDMKGTP